MATRRQVKKAAKASEVKAAEKTVETKVEEVKKAAEEKVEEVKKAVEEKAVEVKKATEEKVAEVKKAAEEKVEEVKETAAEVKKATAKKVAAKKTAAKKPAAKKEIKTSVVLQYGEKEVNTKDMVAAVKKEWTKAKHKVSEIKSMELYIKPEDYAVYYVINGDTTGKIWL